MSEGTVLSIHIAPEAQAAMQTVAEVRAFPGRGLEGDRYFAGTGFWSKSASYGGREVTLIEVEAVQAVSGGEPGITGEELTQPGVLGGLVHRGGLRAQILSEGTIRVGDVVA